ncbi:MAG TPA: hypothetical protein VHH53_13660, partial [Pseudonocardiaceae bacterium]|nr:hypothetical protein [Pseudonocardiaceae bacterium]
MLAGVVLGNGVHCAGGMTAMAIEDAASSRMPAGTPGAFTMGAQRPPVCPGCRHLRPRGHCGGTVNFVVCVAGDDRRAASTND